MVQQSTKMTCRNSATIQRYFERFGTAPRHMALGFAAYLCYMQSPDPSVQDDQATRISALWEGNSPETVVRQAVEILKLTADEQQAKNFTASVLPFLKALLEDRSEEHTSELQSLMRISYAVFCLKKKTHNYKKLTLQYHLQSACIQLHDTVI